MKLGKSIRVLLIAIAFSALSGVTTFAATSKVSDTTKRYIVKFKTSSVNESKVISKYSKGFKHQYKHLNASIVDMTTQSIANLKKDPDVEYVEEDNKVKISSSSLTNWGVADIKASTSWQSGYTGKGVKIAVIDTGAGPHPDLSVTGGTNVINGANSTSYVDDNGHGTHVTGIIAAKGLYGGVKGVAPDASVYAVKALDSSGSGYTSDIIAGIDWAIENKMNIITMSLGSNQSDTSLQQAVDTAYNNGILVVAAAGNDGNAAGTGTNVEYPANYSSVIAVGAVDSTNKRAGFSSSGSKVEVSAPGVNITSTYLNGGYVQMTGTSMATPFVAGDLALLKQEYPTDTNVQLRQLLDENVLDLGVQGKDNLYGYGLIVAPGNLALAPISTPVSVPSTIAIPTASLASGMYTSSQVVSLRDTNSSVSIYYTLDGTVPTSKSNLYLAPITISSTKTLKAVAIDSNGNSSAIFSATYLISGSTVIPVPVTNIQAGTYRTSLLIQLFDKYSKPLLAYYTLDGSTPTTNSIPYTGYIYLKSTCTLKVIAVDFHGNTSGVLTSTYNISR